MADESPGFLGSDYERCEVGSVVSDQPVETLSPGSARSRFYALRFAALKTAKALAAKRNYLFPRTNLCSVAHFVY